MGSDVKGKHFVWIALAAIVLLALMVTGGLGDSSGDTRAWCEVHENDRFTSFNDPVARRYAKECTR